MSRAGWSRPPWWAWPSLLVIDAPVVAVAWAWALARAAGAPFGGVEAAAVASGTAAVYLLDRARDAARLAGDRPPTLRHGFAATRTRSVAVAAVVAGLVTLYTISAVTGISRGIQFLSRVNIILAFFLLAPGSVFTPWLATPLWLVALPGVCVLAMRLNRDRTSTEIDSATGLTSAVTLLATFFVQAITLVLALMRHG